jgi:DNA (cytosine-5)-methyltransferase 1
MRRKKTYLKVGTLFSGLGAPEFALKSLGVKHKVIIACDNDPVVKKTYLHNHTCEAFYDDVTAIEKLPDMDLLVFGFPCQPFSLAGKRGGLRDPRGTLILRVLELMKVNPPRRFIAENVEGLIKIDEGRTLKYLLRRLKKLGYNVAHGVRSGVDFGVPQNRRRLWIVGALDKDVTLPAAYPTCPGLEMVLNKNAPSYTRCTPAFLQKEKVRSKLGTYRSPYINCITQTISRNGSSSEYISYVAAVNHAVGEQRKPSVEECSKLFGLPETFSFPDDVCITRRYNMLANSMIVTVVGAIIDEVLCEN